MSDEALTPTLTNFDAIVAAKTAALESGAASSKPAPKASAPKDDAPDTTERPWDETRQHDGQSDDEPEPEEESEASEDDEPEAEGDDDDSGADVAAEQTIGRVPLKVFRKALESRKASPELMEALGDIEFEVPVDGEKRSVTLRELPGGWMRQQHYSKAMGRARELEANAQRIQDIERARTQTWRQDDGALETGLRLMGCSQALDRLFWRKVEEQHRYWSATPEQRQQWDQMQAERQQRAQEQAEMAELKRQLAIAQQQQQQQHPLQDPATRQMYEYIERNMDRVLAPAMKAAKAGPVSPLVRSQFIGEFQYLASRGAPVDEAMAQAADLVAGRFADIVETARADDRAKQPPEVGRRRVPAGNAAPKQGEVRASKRSKVAPTAAEFGRRFLGE